jgi:hypothetical protein
MVTAGLANVRRGFIGAGSELLCGGNPRSSPAFLGITTARVADVSFRCAKLNIDALFQNAF